jgi:uncharacterized caspase-like protein
MRSLVIGLIALLFWGGLAASARAEVRLGLVIGNNAYANLQPLGNAVTDARLVGRTLRKLGFDVVERSDASRDTMIGALEELQSKAAAAGGVDVVVIYFAGHGVQLDGVNYLLPVDVRGTETSIRNSAIPAASFLNLFQDIRGRGSILMLDACRNDPFKDETIRPKRGLAEIDARTGSAVGAVLAYATAPGATAADGLGENGPYAQAIAEAFQAPGFTIEEAFRQVSARVAALTGDAQTPWMASSLRERVVLVPGNDAQARAAFEVATESSAWERVSARASVADIEWFLRRFPSGVHADQARAQIRSLREAAQAAELRRAGADAGFGVTLRMRSVTTRQGADQPALEVTSVAETSAFFGKLLRGDFITGINNTPVSDQTDPANLLRISAADRRSIFLSIRRGNAVYDVAVRSN